MGKPAAAGAAWRNNRCFACGSENPRGLHLRFNAGKDRAAARWLTSSELESFRDVVHGGLVATVLDEAMSHAAATSGTQALTCELRVRLRRPVTAGEDLEVRGWVVERRKRRILTEATLCGPDGTERAHAWATFLEPL